MTSMVGKRVGHASVPALPPMDRLSVAERVEISWELPMPGTLHDNNPLTISDQRKHSF